VHALLLPPSLVLARRPASSPSLSLTPTLSLAPAVPDADHLNLQSGRAVSTSYNAQEPNLRAQLWVDWHIFSTLARALSVPVFPIQPAKVALVLATYAEMPLSPVLRHVAHLASPHDPFAIPNVFEALNLAAKATRHLWTDVACFVRSADNYEATAVLHAHVNELVCVPLPLLLLSRIPLTLARRQPRRLRPLGSALLRPPAARLPVPAPARPAAAAAAAARLVHLAPAPHARPARRTGAVARHAASRSVHPACVDVSLDRRERKRAAG